MQIKCSHNSKFHDNSNDKIIKIKKKYVKKKLAKQKTQKLAGDEDAEPACRSTVNNAGGRLAPIQWRYATVCSVEHARVVIKNALENRRYKTFNHYTTYRSFTSCQPIGSFLLCYNTFAFYPELTVSIYRPQPIIFLHPSTQ
jgi:hypothetical protein